MKILVDTGPLLSAANKKDPASGMATTVLGMLRRNAVVPMPVMVEADHLIRRRVGDDAARRFMKTLVGGAHEIAFMTQGLMRRAAELDSRYADLNLGLVDGCVMAIAERHELPILTFDFTDFRATESATGPWRLAIDERLFRREVGE
jgi:uncharacterized protein